MARPVAADAEATRRRILDVARHLFSAQGEGSTSMRQIAKGAGVSLATVHHYFGSKAELYQTAIDVMYEELALLRAELEPVLLGAADVKWALREAIRRTYAFVRNHTDEVRLMMRTVLATGTLEASRRDDFLLPLLEQGSMILNGVTGVELLRARMTLLTMNHLVIRYALTADEELVLVTAVGEEGSLAERTARATERVEDHLVEIAADMLGVR